MWSIGGMILIRTQNFVHKKSHVYWPWIYPGPWLSLNLLGASI
jgi:hypothetical protein